MKNSYFQVKVVVMKKYAAICISFLVLLGGCERPKGFTLKKILSAHSNNACWAVTPLPPKDEKTLSLILKQPFSYLGSGNHCYAFESEDGQYVLKFFKQNHMRTQSFIDYLPLPSKRLYYPFKKLKHRIKEREKSFTSYKIAYELLKEETGLFYLHLNKTDHLNKIVTLIDQHGTPIKIDIDQMEFLIQKKAKLTFEYLGGLINSSREEEALEGMNSLLQLIVKRKQKGIFDCDLQFYKNFGFIGNKAIEIDIGNFKMDSSQKDPKRIRQEVTVESAQLKNWIEINYPQLSIQVEDLIIHAYE